MNVPTWFKPAAWGFVVGAIAITTIGFSEMGWTTGSAADRMASDRANSAVVAALVPFCVANAEHDPDQAKLAKFRSETSSYARSEIVSVSGWATMPGMSTPNGALAFACSEKLQGPKA